MGNQISNRRPAGRTGKVILSDGGVHEYDQPLTVAELMLEYPQQVVVEFQSVTAVAKRPCPLPADKKLETDKVYVMLPIKRGKPASLSSEESRQLLFRANNMLKSRTFFSSTTGFLPFFARICPAGNWEESHGYVVKKRDKLGEKMEDDISGIKEDLFGEILEERPEYLNRQVSGKAGWKPSLDTIKEKVIKPKVRHWLY